MEEVLVASLAAMATSVSRARLDDIPKIAAAMAAISKDLEQRRRARQG